MRDLEELLTDGKIDEAISLLSQKQTGEHLLELLSLLRAGLVGDALLLIHLVNNPKFKSSLECQAAYDEHMERK